MKKLALILICVAAFAVNVQADLVEVDLANKIFKTTTGGQVLYWYLNLDSTFNKTFAEQEAVADGLSFGIGADDWHIASESEVGELLGTGLNTTQATLVANKLFDLGYSTGIYYTNKFTGRIDKEVSWSPGKHHLGQLSEQINNPGVYSPGTSGTDIFFDKHQDIAAWIVATPEPATICLLGLGGLVLVRKRK